MSENIEYKGVIQSAINLMGDKPRDLARAIVNAADTREVDFPTHSLQWLANHFGTASPNDEIEHMLGLALRRWDRLKDDAWCDGTVPLSELRRRQIYNLLKVPEVLVQILDQRLPPYAASDAPVVMAEKHEPWYSEARRKNRYYWESYSAYLQRTRGWDSTAIGNLDHATDAVLAALSDPSRIKVHKSKGLVVGYVQSGKTSHFTGVLAKAADAGYRLIVVLAGTLDILRFQTQRRIDKELIGKELLESEYVGDEDWIEFVSHGERPSDSGHYDWERLTGLDDYRSLKHGIGALAFSRKDPTKSFNDPTNLRHAPVRLLVIKKNAGVIANFSEDLSKATVRALLSDVPALIVDDESDQAGINTVDPRKKLSDLSSAEKKAEKKAAKDRSSINAAITGLMTILPRAQYVGYTATPFANVLINPKDAVDLFPRDFIISLPRPAGYMGVRDFYDLGETPDGFASNKKAHVFDIYGSDEDADNLPKAIDSFVLAGAIKLFRSKAAPKLYRYRHHTMLVHHSAYRRVHGPQALKISELWENCAYQSKSGLARLRQLFDSNFAPVSSARAPEFPMPRNFDELIPCIQECLDKLNSGKTVRIVNGENLEDTPDFEKSEIWAILVGGAKLSRGYTVEGLTITYFRRVATASDTLMQMGRWFGFRPGFHDLVRLFIGRKEPVGQGSKPAKKKKGGKKKAAQRTFDLYEAFRALCLDEEEFRADIQKYALEGIRPIDVPPLIPSHLRALAPTAKNKMRYAKVVFENFGGKRKEPTLAPTDDRDADYNSALAVKLLTQASLRRENFEFRSGDDQKVKTVRAYCGIVSPSQANKFLRNYRWETRADLLEREIAFLEGKRGNPEIDRWLIVAPDMAHPGEVWPKAGDEKIGPLPVRHRSRIGHRYGALSEPYHVKIANYLSGIDESSLTPVSKSFVRLKTARTAVMLIYPVKDESEDFVSILFTLQFPKNSIVGNLMWTVRTDNELASPG